MAHNPNAAPILFDAFARTGKLAAPLPKAPKGTLMASNAKLPLPLRRFRPLGELVRSGSGQSLRIQFPLNGSRIDASNGGAPAYSSRGDRSLEHEVLPALRSR